MGYEYAIAGEKSFGTEAVEFGDSADPTENGCSFGIAPIILPHKNRARYVFALNEYAQSGENPVRLYQVIECNQSTLLGGALGFVSFGPFAVGAGLAGQYSKEYTSVRLVSGRDVAYQLPELAPPKSVDDIDKWPSRYTNMSFNSVRSFKCLAGVYAIAHAGAIFEIEGLWEHRLIKENEIISLYLTLKKQKRLKLTSGVAPVLMNNVDLAHIVCQTQLVFQFKNIETDPKAREILNELLTSSKKSTLKKAISLAEECKENDPQPSIVFTTEKIREEKESRNRARFRVPLFTNNQLMIKKRERSEQTDNYFADNHYQTQKVISEHIRRYEAQRPIDYMTWRRDNHVYPNRMRFNSEEGYHWPLDYKNKKKEKITQVIKIKNGRDGQAYETNGIRFLWTVTDNYITREKFLAIYRDIGKDTGLLPLFFNEIELPVFLGPPTLEKNFHESMLLSLQVTIRDFEKRKIYTRDQ